ncbi:MAG: GGDEF domain-containing protein [Gammaproteobacteria bacterium]|nr:GGDEF domain-containing protein [Gammaproteobacteria bacterium]
MATQASNIIDVTQIRPRRPGQKATVQSLVRLESPPDLQQLSTLLQTTLELDEMLRLFHEAIAVHLPVDGLVYRHAELGLVLQQGLIGCHSASYALSLQHEALGELSISRSHPFAEQELATLEHLLCALLYPIRNGLRYRTALASAFLDPLTGLNNRAALDRALAREVELAHRNDLPLYLLVVDLDFFKKVNDQYGHLAGDCVLRSFANTANQQLRQSDELFRYGGEEFVVILPGTDRDGALMVAERIRQQIASMLCECEGITIPVTCSIGVAALDIRDNAHSLFDRADKALYQAKHTGRNRVCEGWGLKAGARG